MDKKLQKAINLALDIPRHKLFTVVSNQSLLIGAYGYLMHCGYELNPELAEIFIRQVEIKLVGHEEVEHEWTEEQWDNCQYLKTLGSQIIKGKYRDEPQIVESKYESKT